MPKEKSTTATTRTKRATKGEGRKKKGMYPRRRLATLAMLTFSSDPNQPKRGLSAYMFFANEQRDKVREDNPISWLTCYRRGRQEARRAMEVAQRQAEGALRCQGQGRQAALRGGEGRLHCRTLMNTHHLLNNQTNTSHRAAMTRTKSKRVPTSTAHLPPTA
jgi:hypothetical protein